jgi:hypothetical protein
VGPAQCDLERDRAGLLQFAKYGLPDDPDDGVAMSEFFVDVLVADDDDADLSNGTPHSTPIINAFNAHGIGTNFFMNATHTPIQDPGSTGPFPVAATITYGGPIGSFASAKLFYSANGSNWFQVPMPPTGNPDEYGAQIGKVSYGVARYYLLLTDSYGGTSTVPPGAPQLGTYQFIAGAASTLNFYDMESTPPGWTVGFSGDAATTGVWERKTPQATCRRRPARTTRTRARCAGSRASTPFRPTPGRTTSTAARRRS